PAYAPIYEPALPRWRRHFTLALATPLVLVASLIAWNARGPQRTANVVEASPAHAEPEHVEADVVAEPEHVEEAHATAVGDERVARPIVTPLDPEPVPAEPAETESQVESAVAHASPVPAR